MAISKKTWTGTAREATAGTAVITPTKYIPTKTTFKAGKKRVYLNEERGDRNANYGVVDSVRQSAIDMKGPYYNDVSPIALWAGMGLPVTTQPSVGTDPTVYLHTFALANVPPSYTINRSLDAVCYYIPYSVLEKWTLSFDTDGKLLELDDNWLGLWAQVNGAPPTPSYSTLLPFAGYAPTIKFVDNVVSTDVIDLQIEFSQKVTLWYPANGAADFVTAYFGERDIKVTFTARFDNTTIYDRFRSGTNDALTFDVQGPTISNTYKQELNIVLPTISYDSVEHDTSKENVLIKAKATAIVPQGSALITGFVQNTVASYTT
jgi:hypothetical protein